MAIRPDFERIDLFYGQSHAVRSASIALGTGEVVAITGQSGSGKSSLLYCLAGVLPVARGEVRFENRVLGELDDEELSTLRRDRFG
ncbi:ATP-binding cassette domain-containing protein [Streptomyces sp. NPDC001595]|uniref:ATP-binding cassette domain-containing protein n=1 Tax=Streptomyces sp. NPDC001532 TaxID=3154520 RepID=UPI0033276149